jgi:hypothetical protein
VWFCFVKVSSPRSECLIGVSVELAIRIFSIISAIRYVYSVCIIYGGSVR